MTTEPADKIANCALDHYDSLGNKGKPRQQEEWTVFAAIVAQKDDSLWVVASATGSKCTTLGPDGVCLRDMHAEVLSKRGLQRVLWGEMKENNSMKDTIRLLKVKDGVYRLKEGLRLHLYVSDSPCGDASIYRLSSGAINFTGAKAVLRDSTDDNNQFNFSQRLLTDSNTHMVRREDVQQLGALRIKSGRSNLPAHLRSTCMSCSDKIFRWMTLGLQSSSMENVTPVRLSSIIVSRDPTCIAFDQHKALERATKGRVQIVLDELGEVKDITENLAAFVCGLQQHPVSVHIVDQVFLQGMSETKSASVYDEQISISTPAEQSGVTTEKSSNTKRKRDCLLRKQASPCGFSLNWNAFDNTVEVVVGARGILQGKKPKSTAGYVQLASRLCRQSMVQHCSVGSVTNISYRTWKESKSKIWNEVRNAVLSARCLVDWLRSDRDFELNASTQIDG